MAHDLIMVFLGAIAGGMIGAFAMAVCAVGGRESECERCRASFEDDLR